MFHLSELGEQACFIFGIRRGKGEGLEPRTLLLESHLQFIHPAPQILYITTTRLSWGLPFSLRASSYCLMQLFISCTSLLFLYVSLPSVRSGVEVPKRLLNSFITKTQTGTDFQYKSIVFTCRDFQEKQTWSCCSTSVHCWLRESITNLYRNAFQLDLPSYRRFLNFFMLRGASGSLP